MHDIRTASHSFIVENFQLYQNLIILPFIDTVGTGPSASKVVLTTYEEVKEFLLSQRSYYTFSNYLDLYTLATLFNVTVSVSEFSSDGSMIPRWLHITPNQTLTPFSPFGRNGIGYQDMWLYDEKSSDFNLLVSGFLCPLSMTTNIVTEDITEESLTLPDDNPVTVFSPIDFKICPRAVGRLKKRRFEAPSLLKSKRTATEQTNSETKNSTEVRKKRGQPKDSKIRAKIMNHCPKGQRILQKGRISHVL